MKKAGTIRVMIGPPIDTRGLEPREINERAQRWIEARSHASLLSLAESLTEQFQMS